MAAALPYAPSRAPWREILDYHLRRTPGYEFTIATIGINQQGRAVPRVRVCGFRGFFPVLQLHPNGELDMKKQVANGGNPPTFESDMLTFTTDARMEKIEHLQSSGQEIEALFWFKEVSSQWRVKGKAFAIGNPCGEKDQKELESRAAIRKALSKKSHDGCQKEGWSWEHAVTKYFAHHSPAMRGTFKAPPPGRSRDDTLVDSSWSQGQTAIDLYDKLARDNFRVVVICPEEVEQLDLSDTSHLRRYKWTLQGDSKDNQAHPQWVQTELWP